ncbi:MAG: hypothetical protein IPL83_12975 [Bdellovibrionales bacterium]|nr:hypothetical protein [Bdellovibrionales bacterium]
MVSGSPVWVFRIFLIFHLAISLESRASDNATVPGTSGPPPAIFLEIASTYERLYRSTNSVEEKIFVVKHYLDVLNYLVALAQSREAADRLPPSFLLIPNPSALPEPHGNPKSVPLKLEDLSPEQVNRLNQLVESLVAINKKDQADEWSEIVDTVERAESDPQLDQIIDDMTKYLNEQISPRLQQDQLPIDILLGQPGQGESFASLIRQISDQESKQPGHSVGKIRAGFLRILRSSVETAATKWNHFRRSRWDKSSKEFQARQAIKEERRRSKKKARIQAAYDRHVKRVGRFDRETFDSFRWKYENPQRSLKMSEMVGIHLGLIFYYGAGYGLAIGGGWFALQLWGLAITDSLNVSHWPVTLQYLVMAEWLGGSVAAPIAGVAYGIKKARETCEAYLMDR